MASIRNQVAEEGLMAEGNTFQELIDKVRAGDEAAATDLMRLYEPAIRRAVRVRMINPRLRRLLDSTDICQSVFGSFFVRAALGQYELDSPEHLLKLLIDMSCKKLADQGRREKAARRDYRRVRDIDQNALQLPAAGDSPSQQVEARDLLSEVRKRLSPEERWLAEQRAQGRDWAQIAADQGGSPEALRKKLGRAVDRVTNELGLDG
jgi:RNA polymerase sigma-70 factor (ECF subfamily)